MILHIRDYYLNPRAIPVLYTGPKQTLTNGEAMSKSKLRSKYMRSLYKGHSLFTSKINNPVRNPHRQDEMPKRDQRQSGWGDGRSGRDVKVQYVSVRGKPCWYFAEPLPSEANKSWPAKKPQERIRKRLIIKDDDFEFLRLCSISAAGARTENKNI
jgi:hypothetical protein